MTQPTRKGAQRRADIPPHVLRAINHGDIETITLVEWLAVDMTKLLGVVSRELDLPNKFALPSEFDELGIIKRTETVAMWLHDSIWHHPNREAWFGKLAGHRSDVVRSWAAYVPQFDPSLSLAERLSYTQRFAADLHMGVRECAWMATRPFVTADLNEGLALLAPWVGHNDANVRRCAVEMTRPRGVWCAHIQALKEEPSRALPLLEPLKSDSSLYVRRSVANWLNDASKSRPDWVLEVCDRWAQASPTPETQWLVRHATRTLRKAGR